MAEGSSIIGYTAGGPTLTYSGSATMFTGVDVNCTFKNVSLDCPLAKVWDISETVGSTKTLSIRTVVVISCDTLGTINDLRTFFAEAFSALNITTNGFNFVGGNFVLIALQLASIQSTSATFIGMDLGTAVADTIRVIETIFDGVSGGIGLKGTASNANLTAAGIGEMTGCSFRNAITPVDTIDLQNDINWIGFANQGLADTRPDSLSYNTAGTTVVIATMSVPVIIAGTWIDDNSAHFTVDLAGVVTYIGLEDLHVPIDAVVTADPVSGGSIDFSVCIAINGSVVAASSTPAQGAAGDLIAVPVVWQHIFQTKQKTKIKLMKKL